MQEQDVVKAKNKKRIRGVLVGIVAVGIITGILLTPKILALKEYNSLASKVNQIPTNSQLNTLEARIKTIDEIDNSIEQLKIANEELGGKNDSSVLIAQKRLQNLREMVKKDREVSLVFNKTPSSLNDLSSSHDINNHIKDLKKEIALLDNLDPESVFNFRKYEVNNIVKAKRKEISKFENSKEIALKRELKETRERELKERRNKELEEERTYNSNLPCATKASVMTEARFNSKQLIRNMFAPIEVDIDVPFFTGSIESYENKCLVPYVVKWSQNGSKMKATITVITNEKGVPIDYEMSR